MTVRVFHLAAGLLLSLALIAPAASLADDKSPMAAETAPRPLAVVELFTSQGCSSCPPADELLGKFVKRDDVIALTFNVDYWDYLGWKDTLADPAYGARQRDYAKARGDGQVYTPQAVVNGLMHVVGSQEAALERAIGVSMRKLNGERVPISVSVEGDALLVNVGAAPDGATVKPATVWLALIKRSEIVKIKRGENRGKTITYFNVVRNLTPVGRWTGEKMTVKLPKYHLKKNGTDDCAALLQQDTAGPIIAAAKLERW